MENNTEITVPPIETLPVALETPMQQDPILAIIAGAAQSNVNIDVMEGLYKLYEKTNAYQAEKMFNEAFAKMQGNLPRIAEKGKTNNGKYVLLEDIIDVCSPILQKYGFSIHTNFLDKDGKTAVVCKLIHQGGFSRDTTTPFFPNDTSGNKNAIQAVASTMTYLRRYAIVAALNISSGDDDGVAAGKKVWQASKEHRASLIKAYQEADAATQSVFETNYGSIQDGGFDNWLSSCTDALNFQKRLSAIQAKKVN